MCLFFVHCLRVISVAENIFMFGLNLHFVPNWIKNVNFVWNKLFSLFIL